ncbi:hypothetical protein FNV43_RR10172 [Rhamnella rubrinervis]|uniref:Uncharacterized protein n=1 Tax=Rhamnella rubrinervis TaxID=2594499 RepID=A0A8K0HCN1_9ROSA|nr:hypothetical protein FNV43_RR10172 [Rhamnella rubrinervis]
MSLNCLTCSQVQRTNSDQACDRKHGKDRNCKKICCVQVDRSWSGNLAPPPYEHIFVKNASMLVAKKKVVKAGHRRLYSTGAVTFEGTAEPRLVRSSGMRRDWSFEDLRPGRDEKKGRIQIIMSKKMLDHGVWSGDCPFEDKDNLF